MRNLLAIGIILPIIGVIMLVLGVQEQNLAATASKEPEEISLKDLIARGPNGNPNVILKDFLLCENYVFKTQNTRWTSAWVPAVPSQAVAKGQARGGPPPVVQALIFTINAQGEQDLYQRCSQPRLRALVTNRIVSLGAQERTLLEQNYPGTDFTRCLIIQEGREPAGWGKFIIMIGGGSVATLVGLGLLGLAGVSWLRQPAPKIKRRRDDEDDEDERPRKRKRRDREDDERDADDEDERSRKRKRRDREDADR